MRWWEEVKTGQIRRKMTGSRQRRRKDEEEEKRDGGMR